MIVEKYEAPLTSSGISVTRIRKIFIPEVMDLKSWNGERDAFSMFDIWINAVTQRYVDENYSIKFEEMSEESRLEAFNEVSSILVELRNQHRMDPKDALSEVKWDDNYESLIPVLKTKLNFK